jgi:acetyltransferase-like isoleucine patch superfamily enzyme
MIVSRTSADAGEKLRHFGFDHNIPANQLKQFFGLIEPPARISETRIFHHFSIGAFSYVSGGFLYDTKIGRYCSLANGLHIGQGNHPMTWLSSHPFQYQRLVFRTGGGFPHKEAYESDAAAPKGSKPRKPVPTVIGNDVWLGHGVYARNGVVISDGAVVGARSVVVGNIPPYAVAVGSPARVIRYRFPEPLIARLRESKWWRFAPWQLSGLDFAAPDRALDQLEERIAKGLEPYSPQKIELRP